jgi:hypothetical protein
MRPEFKLIFFSAICVLGLFVLTSSNLKKKSRSFVQHTKYSPGSLRLFDNGKYHQSKSDCTYHFTTKGTWEQIGDTIYLNQEKTAIKRGHSAYSDRALKLYVNSPDSLIYVWELEFGINHWLVLSEE